MLVSQVSERILQTILRHKSGAYCKDLIRKYHPKYPIWVLVELIPFGVLLHLCSFYERLYKITLLPDHKMMNIVRDIRNATAHSNCLMNQMITPMDATKQANLAVVQFIAQINSISKASRRKYLGRMFTYNISTLLYVYHRLVTGENKRPRYAQVHDLMNIRMLEHKEYFARNLTITGTYDYFKKIIDYLDAPA